jgi:serine/threonine protein kinase
MGYTGKETELDHGDDIDSLLNVQIFGRSQLLTFSIPNQVESLNVEKFANAESLPYRPFTATELVRLLDELDVPYLRHCGSLIGAPDSLIGRGGNADIKYDKVRSRYDDVVRERGAAIKEFGWRSSTQDEKMSRLEEIESTSSSSITQAYMEICIMKHPFLSTHPNVLQLLGTADYSNSIIRSSGWAQLCLVTEYADLGSLDAYLSRHTQTIEWSFKCQLICDIAAGLQAIHDCDIVHNDVKCGNVLLFSASQSTDRIVAKISDFGSSIPLPSKSSVYREGATAIYAPPEACYPNSTTTVVHRSRDLFSFGLAILHIITEEEPLIGSIPEDEIQEFKRKPEFVDYVGDILRSSAPTRLESPFTTLVKKALDPVAEKRLSDLTQVNTLLPESYEPFKTYLTL